MQHFQIERADGVAVCTMINPPMNYLTTAMTQYNLLLRNAEGELIAPLVTSL